MGKALIVLAGLVAGVFIGYLLCHLSGAGPASVGVPNYMGLSSNTVSVSGTLDVSIGVSTISSPSDQVGLVIEYQKVAGSGTVLNTLESPPVLIQVHEARAAKREIEFPLWIKAGAIPGTKIRVTAKGKLPADDKWAEFEVTY